MEAWILKKLSKKGEVLVSMSECVTLSSENQRFCEANGMYIDGKAKKRDGNFIVKLSGCSGIELKRTATIKPGEQAVYLVKGRRRIFGAIRPETL
ncbi:MAG: hypothetical protein NXI22_08080 [bacterium]|nr:hypothetical protein [bacterium]